MIFFAKIGIFCKSIAGPKLIICQIRDELSDTIHDISSSWKKRTLDGGAYI